MAEFTGRYWLTFDKESGKRPIICEMSRKFDIVFNIRQSSVSEETGVIALQLEGARKTVDDAIVWLESEGVQVKPVEIQTIEG